MRNKIIPLFLLAICIVPVMADSEDGIVLSVSPTGTIPLGQGANSFLTGFGGSFAADYRFPGLSFLGARADIGYSYMPLITKDGLSQVYAKAGPELVLDLGDSLELSAFGSFGYWYGSVTGGSDISGGNLIFSCGIKGFLALNSWFGLSLTAEYLSMQSLYDGINITLGVKMAPAQIPAPRQMTREVLSPGVSGKGLDVKELRFNKIFPVLFKQYDSTPIGSIELYNNERKEISSVSLSFFVDRYMDNPLTISLEKPVPAESSALVDIYGLFSDSVLDITEGTKVSSNITLKYTINKKETSREYAGPLELYDRNAITWDDDRKAAAFVTAKDPAVLELAKNVSAWIREDIPTAIPNSFALAMGIHIGLKEYGMNYQVDPKTPFSEYSAQEYAVDFLQFPRQTLAYSSGDCDDLSILYCALLESVGIETAFVTVPGHIFMAFDLGLSIGEALNLGFYEKEIIFSDDRVWVPLEITLVQESFKDAWAYGAKEWRKYYDEGTAKLYPTHESWKEYQSVGLPGSTSPEIPDKNKVVEDFNKSLGSYIDQVLFTEVDSLKEQIQRSNSAAKYVNRLGSLYAKYGQYDKATDQFEDVLKNEEYVPSLINMGNIRYIQSDMQKALEYYERAALIEPESPTVLLSLARTNFELEDYLESKNAYLKLKRADYELAEKYAYLDLNEGDTARASSAVKTQEGIIWDEN